MSEVNHNIKLFLKSVKQIDVGKALQVQLRGFSGFMVLLIHASFSHLRSCGTKYVIMMSAPALLKLVMDSITAA